MLSLNALSLTPDVNNWLESSHSPRILHVFDQACNLINERREVLSIVTPQIGNGPFNLVVEDRISFSQRVEVGSPVSTASNRLVLGDLVINTTEAEIWNPRPDWETLHVNRDNILNQLMKFSITNDQFSNSLFSALVNADLSASLVAAKQLAGLGQGLTPAGDDFLLGAIYAAWIIHPPAIAGMLAKEIANSAAPLTTSLSGAWLRSAGKGEAGILWHEFFDALTSVSRIGNPTYKIAVPTYEMALQKAIERILGVGETSGADAMAGFIGTFMTWAERPSSKTP